MKTQRTRSVLRAFVRKGSLAARRRRKAREILAADVELLEARTLLTVSAIEIGTVTPDIHTGAVAEFKNGEDLPAGTYRIDYVEGALHFSDEMLYFMVAIDDPPPWHGYMVRHSAGQSEQLPSDTERHTTQAAAEAANEGVSLEFEHSGGAIGVYLLDSPYYDNRDGNPNPTWKLSWIPEDPDVREVDATPQPDDGSVKDDPWCPDCTQIRSISTGNPHPILHFDIDLPSTGLPAYYSAELEVNGTTVVSDKQFTVTSGLAGETARFSIQFDASNLETGFYDYTLTLSSKASDGSTTLVQTLSSRVGITNWADSEYGNRWWLPFLDRLDVDEATDANGGVGLMRGDRTTDFFAGTGGSYDAPDDIFAILTQTDSGYTLESPLGWTKHFDAAGLLTQVTDRNGRVLQSFSYTDADADGLVDELAAFTQADGHVATYTYDTNGLLSESSNGRGATYHYYYNADRTLERTTAPPAAAGGQIAEISYTYDPATKLMLTKTDVRGLVTTFSYGDDLRVRSIDRPQTGVEWVSPSQVVGLDQFVLLENVVSTSEIDGKTVTRTIGPLGYATKSVDANGNIVEYVRDARGLVTELHETNPAGGTLVTKFSYNSRGNVTKITHPDATFVEYTYAANGLDLLSFRDERGKIWTYTVDAAGNRLTATDPLNNTTTYTYDARGNLETVTTADPDGAGPQTALVTSYDYDTQDRLTQVTNPDLTFRTITYDTVTGNIATTTDERDFTTSYAYNARGWMTSMTLPDPDGTGPQAAPVWSYDYCGCGSLTSVTDPEGNVTLYEYGETTGLLESTTSPDPDGAGPLPSLVTTYQYDALGRLIAETAPGNRVTSYTYDNNGNLIKTTLPDPDGTGPQTASVWEYGYDSLNRQIWSEDPYDERTSFTYDSQGRLLTATDPTGYVSTYFYTPDGRPLQTGAPKLNGSLAAPGPLTEYTFDDAGRLTAVANPLGEATSYAYDAIGRVESVTGPDPDGTPGPQTIIAAGKDAGGLAEVRVFDAVSQELLLSITPYASYTGPVRVAAADVNGDGVADIVVAPSAGVIPRVKVFDGTTGGLIT